MRPYDFQNHGKRNFGCGKQLGFAGEQALRLRYQGGHFATVARYGEHWKAFAGWCKAAGVKDARAITTDVLGRFVAHLKQSLTTGRLAIATAQVRVTAINQTLEAMRGDRNVRVDSPRKALGMARTFVRTRPPACQDPTTLAPIAKALREAGLERAAAIAWLARACGMRRKEATLADLPRLRREAATGDTINIQDGTKGGRKGARVPRRVPVTPAVRAALDAAWAASPAGSRNLLRPDESFRAFLDTEIHAAYRVIKAHGLRKVHELRAAYACQRYAELTGHTAPVHGGTLYGQHPGLDRAARLQISHELGHRRIDVVAAYVGGRK